jgi:hypothetical protein
MQKKQLSIIERLRHARRVSVPLVAINTADPEATVLSIARSVNGGPVIRWDSVRGVGAVNQAGKEVAAKFSDVDATGEGGATTFLAKLADAATRGTMAFMYNADQHLSDGSGAKYVIQAAWNLRDTFKSTGSMLIMLGPSFSLPPHLQNDIIVLDEELPDAEQLAKIVKDQDAAAMVCGKCGGTKKVAGLDCDACAGTGRRARKALSDELVNTAVEAALGLPAFTAEQAVAMSLRPGGKEGTGKNAKDLPTIDIDHLWSTKKSIINQVAGLTVEDNDMTFDDIGGMAHIRDFAACLFSGPYPPSLVVQIAEIEKAMAGTEGDLSGTSQDQLGVLLEAMENNSWNGLICFGSPGTGKSAITKAMANTFGRMSLVLDLGACKGSLVGESEAKVRAAVKTIKAIGGSSVFFVATANKLNIKPELMRRFAAGIWFSDLPSAEEKKAIWKIHRKKYGIEVGDKAPDDTDWTGSDIRNLCRMAHTMGKPLADVLKFSNSNGKVSPETIRAARAAADGRFLNCSAPGVYVLPEKSNQRLIGE